MIVDSLVIPLFFSPELYRFSTFARFPSGSGVTERNLARAGWFYTGVGDRVQCFRCNVTAEGWQPGDCPTEKHRQLSPSCSFIQSLPSTANLLSSSHSAFSPLRIAPAIPVRATQAVFLQPLTCAWFYVHNPAAKTFKLNLIVLLPVDGGVLLHKVCSSSEMKAILACRSVRSVQINQVSFDIL